MTAEAELDMIQEMKERIRIMLDEGVQLKESGNPIEALKKFDEVQNMIKNEAGNSCEDELNNCYAEIAVLCNVLSMNHL